jgi:hypothetical protein
MFLTEYLTSRIGLSPADLRQRCEAARRKGVQRPPSNDAVEEARQLIDNISVLVEEWYAQPRPSDVLEIMGAVPLDDFYCEPTIFTGAERSGLKDKSAAAIVYDYCAAAGLRPSLRSYLVLHSGFSGVRLIISLQ